MREQIIQLARDAGMERVVGVYKDGSRMIEVPNFDLLERFAELVAKHEREQCALVCEQWGTDHRQILAAAIRARGNQ